MTKAKILTKAAVVLMATVSLTIMLTGCSLNGAGGGEAEETARLWADAYFKCDFHEAERYSTAESGRWLRFAASNTTEKALQLLQEKTTEVSIDGFAAANDTAGTATVRVSNYLKPVAIGEEPQTEEDGEFLLIMVKRDGRWKVKMEGLPRSGRQSRD